MQVAIENTLDIGGTGLKLVGAEDVCGQSTVCSPSKICVATGIFKAKFALKCRPKGLLSRATGPD